MEPQVTTTDPAAGHGWIGGNPVLPDGTDWPVMDGVPARFEAQLDCSALPPGQWGGGAPTTGSLVFFCHPDREDRVAVLHVENNGRQRTSPASVSPEAGALDPAASTDTGAGSDGGSAPRWPVRLRPATAADLARRDQRPARNELRHAFLAGVDLDLPEYRPFDGRSARALVHALRVSTQRAVTARSRSRATDDAERAEQLRRLEARLDHLTGTAKAVDTLPTAAPLDAGTVADIVARVQEAHGPDFAIGPRDAAAEQGRSSYAQSLDAHARHLYAVRPEALPSALCDRLLPVWAADAAREIGFLWGRCMRGSLTINWMDWYF